MIALLSQGKKVKDIATARRVSGSAIYRKIKYLESKGFITNRLGKTEAVRVCPPQNSTSRIRIHSQEINIQLLYQSEKYKELLKTKHQFIFKNQLVKLYANSIELYIKESFYCNEINLGLVDSIDFINRLILQLERYLKTILIKPNAVNVKIVKCHYSEIENELARDYEIKKEKLQIKANDDGKLWMIIDNSFNLHEAEFIHSKTGARDARKLINHFNDIRDNDPIFPSILDHHIDKMNNRLFEVASAQLNSQKQLNTLIEILTKVMGSSQNDGVELTDPKKNKKITDYIG